MLERTFNQSGWLYRFLNRLWDILILNFLFLLTSIPLVTIGASLAALYSVTLRAVKGEDGYIARSYLKEWKENLKKATIIWIFYAAAGVILATDIFVIGRNSGDMGKLLVFAGGIAGVIWVLMGIYLLPLQARFENSVSNTVINSLIIAIKFLPNTLELTGIFAMVPLLGIMVAIFIPSLFSWYCSLMFFVGFGGSAYFSSFIYRKVFDRLSAEDSVKPQFEQNAQ